MAISPTVINTRAPERTDSADRHKSELSEELHRAADRLSKKKKPLHEETIPTPMELATPYATIQDRKVQLGKQGSLQEGEKVEAAKEGSEKASAMKQEMSLLKEELNAVLANKAKATEGQAEGASELAQTEQTLQELNSSAKKVDDSSASSKEQASFEASGETAQKMVSKRLEEQKKNEFVSTALPTGSASAQQATSNHNTSTGSPQLESGVNQDVNSQATIMALRDKNTTSGTEIKYSFNTWSGNQTAVISGTPETGYDLNTSAAVRPILEKHLNRLDDAQINSITGDSSTGTPSVDIAAVESATDKQSSGRQSKDGRQNTNDEEA